MTSNFKEKSQKMSNQYQFLYRTNTGNIYSAQNLTAILVDLPFEIAVLKGTYVMHQNWLNGWMAKGFKNDKMGK